MCSLEGGRQAAGSGLKKFHKLVLVEKRRREEWKKIGRRKGRSTIDIHEAVTVANEALRGIKEVVHV